MKISRLWNSVSWAVVGLGLLLPIVSIIFFGISEWRQTGHYEPLYPGTAMPYVIFGVLGVLGGGCLLACLDQLRQYLADRQLAAMQSDFVSAISHELRTPLTTIQLYAEMLRSGAVPEAQRDEFWDGLTHETRRLEGLVEDVLAYRRATEPDARLTLAEHRVEEIAEAALAATRPALVAAGMAIESPSPVPPMVRCRDGSARQNRSNTRSASAGSMPSPESRTPTATAF
jgi:signal transduction histidine kinase